MAIKLYSLKKLIAIGGIILLTLGSCIGAGSPTEYEVKAAFIFNFTRFVEWPSEAFADSSSPFVIGVLGRDPFGSALDEIIKGKNVDGRRLTIKRSDRIHDLTSCHILFISSSVSDSLPRIIDKLKGDAVLTVGDMDRFAKRGGIIGFVMRDSKVSLEINIDVAKRDKLKISSKLLKLAKIVEDR
jgi:hypothetical protein